jgi:gliding-associated putative ABC transporter substrate-binding component GldG
VGYAMGNDEPMDIRVYDLAEKALQESYDLQLINLNKQPFVAPEFKSLIIVKPTLRFSDAEKLKIDQYIMNGGKVLFFIDRLNAEMDSLQIKNEVIAYDRDLNLNDLLFTYGVRINPSLVMDLQCDYLPFDVNGNRQFDFLPWNYFPVLESSNNHPINKNLGYVAARFANAMDTIEVPGIKKTVLLHSSVNGRVIASPALISGKENVTAPEDDKFKTSNIPVVVLLEGKFHSLFANHLTNDLRDSLQMNQQTFVTDCINDNKVLVASDGDLVLNAVVKGNQPLPMGANPFTYGSQRAFPFANKTFFINALEYMINENGLSEAKDKDYLVRLLDSKRINEAKTFWQLINILLPILIVMIFASVFLFIRKRKYTL